MLPSNMLLKPLNQVIYGYNDKLIVNTSGLGLGKQQKPVLKQPIAKKPIVKQTVKRRVHTLDDHNDEVTSVTFTIGGLSLFGFWFLK